MTAKVIVGGIGVAFVILVYLLALPALSLFYIEGVAFWGMAVVLPLLFVTFVEITDEGEFGTLSIIFGVTSIIFLLTLLIGGCAGSPMFRSSALHKQLGTVQERSFTEDIVPIDLNQLPIVDERLARVLGEKKLGEIPALGSQAEVGDFTYQSYNGKLVLVAPIVHNGFFAYNNNKSGTPGYIIVSASNPSDVQLIDNIDGKSVKIQYQPEAFFGRNLKRHLRNNGYFRGLTETSFEISNEGFPYYVIKEYEPTIGWSGKEVTRILVVNATTGEIKPYGLDELPDFVVRVQPESFVFKQLENWGKHVNGWPNWSNVGRTKPTEGIAKIFANGRFYFYTTITSYVNDSSAIGFVMVDTQTKETFFYSMSGATEARAAGAAEDVLQQYEYRASKIPLPINLDGIPTFLIPLKGNSGLIMQYAFVNIQNFNIVGFGDSLASARLDYMRKYTDAGNRISFSDKAYSYTAEDVVKRVSQINRDGTTYFYLLLKDNDSQLFTCSIDISPELVVTEPGDRVKIEYISTNNQMVDIISFDNLEISLAKTEAQIQKEQKVDSVFRDNLNSTTVIGVNSEEIENTWDNLTDQEKAKILKNIQPKQ